MLLNKLSIILLSYLYNDTVVSKNDRVFTAYVGETFTIEWF